MSQKSDIRKHLAAVDQNTVNLDPRKKKKQKKKPKKKNPTLIKNYHNCLKLQNDWSPC